MVSLEECLKLRVLNNYKISFLGKGGKTRKRGKNDNEDYKRELEFKEDGQGRNFEYLWIIHLEYGRVNKMLGNGRVECYCFDGKTRLCNIRGKMRKKVVNVGRL